MKLIALATAATVALATAASAMAPSQIEVETQNTLDRHGFSVDASELSRSEWVAIKSFVSDDDNDSRDIVRRIEVLLER